MSETKFCRDCKFYQPPPRSYNGLSICYHPSTISMETGEPQPYKPIVRRQLGNDCGPDAALFESKSKPKPQGDGKWWMPGWV